VQGAQAISDTVPDGTVLEAALVSTDRAVLRANSPNLPHASLGESGKL